MSWFDARSHTEGEMIPLLLWASAWQDQRGKGSLLRYLQSPSSLKAHRGILQSLSIPQSHRCFCPVMFKPITTALRPGRAEKQKQSRQWADEGKTSMKTKWNRKPDSNKTIGGMPSLPVFPSFVSSAVPVVLLCLQGKGGKKISKLTPC